MKKHEKGKCKCFLNTTFKQVKTLRNKINEGKQNIKVNVPDNYELIPDAESLGKRARYLSKNITSVSPSILF